ncbi:MAG: hypothetical protein KUG64_11005, partial [Cycloclasticus sp.]|nr:hypothetical protein [Cycloclasticus sp.]
MTKYKHHLTIIALFIFTSFNIDPINADIFLSDDFERPTATHFISPNGPWDSTSFSSTVGMIDSASGYLGTKALKIQTSGTATRRAVWSQITALPISDQDWNFSFDLNIKSIIFDANQVHILRVDLGSNLNGSDVELAIVLNKPKAGNTQPQINLRVRHQGAVNSVYSKSLSLQKENWYHIEATIRRALPNTKNGNANLIVTSMTDQTIQSTLLDNLDNQNHAQLEEIRLGIASNGGSGFSTTTYIDNFTAQTIKHPDHDAAIKKLHHSNVKPAASLYRVTLWKSDNPNIDKILITGDSSTSMKDSVAGMVFIGLDYNSSNSNQIDWAINVQPMPGWGVYEVEYPILEASRFSTSGDDERLLIPWGGGHVKRGPFNQSPKQMGSLPRLKNNVLWFGVYPCLTQTMQMLIYDDGNDNGNGVMLWTPDKDGYIKDFTVRPDNTNATTTLLMSTSHFPENTGKINTAWDCLLYTSDAADEARSV